MKLRFFILVAACFCCNPFSLLSQTISVQNTVRGKTPTYLGFNPGESGGYENGKHWGDPNIHGTPAYWLKQCGGNMLRGWGRSPLDEGVWDSPINRNDTDGDGVTTPSGDGVDSQAKFDAARQAVINNPLGNSYINWNYFDKLKFIVYGHLEVKPMGVSFLPVMRYKHGGDDNFPSYMGGTGNSPYDPGLTTWQHRWEWWEYCYAMSYLWAKHQDTTHFEIGNEPEYGAQGGLSIDQQINAILYCHDAIRAGVKAATGKTAVIVACGTNNPDYASAMAGLSTLDGISVHTYGDKVAQMQTFLSLAGSKQVINSEHGSGAGSDHHDSVNTVFGCLNLADSRNIGHLIYIFTGDPTGNNCLVEETATIGLFKPRPAYYGIRMMYRAGLNRKDVYSASSSDSSLVPLITRDSSKTFITIRNTAASSKSYTIGIPSWLTTSKQHSFLWNAGTYLDQPWNGVSINGSVITVTSQPANSYLQIVFGTSPLDVLPEQFDAARYPLGHLSQPYISSSVGTVVSSYSDNFDHSAEMDWAPASKWLTRAYDNGAVLHGKSSSKALLYSQQLHISNADQNPPAGTTSFIWHANQFSMNSNPLVLTTDFGYEDSNGNDDPRIGFCYRDNNGNLIGVRTFPNTSNGKWSCYRFTNPTTPDTFLWATSTDYPNNRVVLNINSSLKRSQKVRVTLTKTTIRVQVYDPNGAVLGDSGTVAHNAVFSGTGRIGLARNNRCPIWFDNMTITTTSGPVNNPPGVSITSPSNGATYNAPATISMSASATDSDGSVSQVQFFSGSISLGTDTSSPYSVTWNSVTAGSYSLTARATDNGGATGTSSAVNITVSNSSSSTSSGGAFSAKINFQVVASSAPAGYVADTGAVYGSRGNGFTYGWNVDNSANARDRNSASSPDERYDTLNHMQRNGTFSWELAVPNGTYSVRAVCGDPGFTDSVYKLNVEGVLTVSGTPTTSSFWVEGTSTVTVNDGRLSVAVGSGGTNVKINFIEVTGANAPINQAPTVSLSSPVNNATYVAPASVALAATASDSDGVVSSVQFFSGSTPLGTDTSSPYAVTWSPVSAGAYGLTARATDNGGASATSSTVNITVNSSSSTTTTPPSGSLSVVKGTQPATLSLNTEGSRDWSHWGLNSSTDWNHKSGVAAQITNITKVGTGTVNRYTDGTMAVSWTGGTPTASASSTRAGIYVAGVNNGFQITVPADPTLRTLRVYCGVWKSQGKMEATLSDGSAPAIVDTSHGSTTGSANTMFSINYNAASAGQSLTVKWTVQTSHDTAGAGTAGWQAASLQ